MSRITVVAFLCCAVFLIRFADAKRTESGSLILVPSGASASAATFDAGVVWIQGMEIPASQYEPLATAVQSAAAELGIRLWVTVPEFPLSIPDPLVLPNVVATAIADLRSAGMPSNASLYAAAHSVGGVFLQTYLLQNRTFAFRGAVLMGSFLTYASLNHSAFSIPTLTLGGEVDGLCRLFRIAEAYDTQILKAYAGRNSRRDFPVTVIAGAAHMSFASGPGSSFVNASDLRPFVSDEAAHAEISNLMAHFVKSQETQSTSLVVDAAMSSSAATYFNVIMNAYELEGNYNTKPPCDCNNPKMVPYGEDPFGWVNYYPCIPSLVNSSCRAGSPWGEQSQTAMGGLTNITYNVTSAFHSVSQTVPNSNLPYIFNNCTEPTPDCILTITTVNENIYVADALDTGFFYRSATEIRGKMMSRQAVMKHSGINDTNFTGTDLVGNLCGVMNERAIAWAVSHAPSDVIARYNTLGQKMIIGPDFEELGPFWIDIDLQYVSNATLNTLTVSSPYMAFPDPFPLVPVSCCFHYCKLLSPARALEWIMLDSLRLRDGVNANVTLAAA